MVVLLSLQIRVEIYSDLNSHVGLHEFYRSQGTFIFPPLYYLSFDILARLLPWTQSHTLAAGLLIGFCLLLKYTLTYVFLIRDTSPTTNIAALLAFGLCLFFPYYLFSEEGSYWYMGKFTPNLWHNGTSIFVWPFCFLLFWLTLYWLRRSSTQTLFLMGLLSLLITLAKPSFLFAYIPVLPLMTWFKAKDKTISSLIFCALLLLFVWGLKVLIYSNPLDALANSQQQSNEVVIAPFAVYRLYAESPLLEILASFAFPFAAFALFGKSLIQNTSVQFSLLLAIAGMLVYLIVAERGFRFEHANFYWQIPICLSLLYLCMVKELCLIFRTQKNLLLNWKFQTLCLLFLAHVGSGVNYLNHYLETKSYL